MWMLKSNGKYRMRNACCRLRVTDSTRQLLTFTIYAKIHERAHMIKYFLLVVFTFLATLSLSVRAEDVGVLHLRPLNLVLPPTWTFDGSKKPIEGHGPDGEKLLITIMKRRLGADTATSASAKDMAVNFSRDMMPTLAAKDGKTIIRPVTPVITAEGKVAFSAASEKSGLFGEQYFVQYLLASDAALIYLTIEGKGKASPVVERFDIIMKTQQWDD
jgi:hypothetical protein